MKLGYTCGAVLCLFCLDFDLPFLPMLKLRALFPLLFCGTKGVVLVFFDLCSTGCWLLGGLLVGRRWCGLSSEEVRNSIFYNSSTSRFLRFVILKLFILHTSAELPSAFFFSIARSINKRLETKYTSSFSANVHPLHSLSVPQQNHFIWTKTKTTKKTENTLSLSLLPSIPLEWWQQCLQL